MVFALIAILALGAIGWHQYDLQQKAEKARIRQAESERVVKALKESGIAARKIWEAQGRPVMDNSDPMAPAELTDQGELAQAKLWQNLSKSQRDLMRANAARAGLPETPQEEK